MASEDQSQQKVSFNVPIGVLAAAAVIGLAGAACTLLSQSSDGADASTSSKIKCGGNIRKKLGLMTLVTLIENDVTRKGVVALLKALAKRG